jgi:three-Cys-motif partner protein
VTNFGGYWTEVKLEVLTKYMEAFNVATKKVGTTVYLDLFAGGLKNRLPHAIDSHDGSSARAMRSQPPFTKLVFWEVEPVATTLKSDLASEFPNDNRYQVISGDCNLNIGLGLNRVADLRWAPTLAFIDPYGLDVSWKTLETLAHWRKDAKRRKVEMWILFSEPGITRVLGLKGVRGESGARTLNRLFGTDDWIAIHQRRQLEYFGAEQTRAEFINLLRWRIEKVLGYSTTHALKLGNVSGSPVYTMIFATDSGPGSKIMSDIYHHAMVHEIPSLRAKAMSDRDARRSVSRGIQTLFTLPLPKIQSKRYEHTPPWEPPKRLGVGVELDAEPANIAVGPDDFNWPEPDPLH